HRTHGQQTSPGQGPQIGLLRIRRPFRPGRISERQHQAAESRGEVVTTARKRTPSAQSADTQIRPRRDCATSFANVKSRDHGIDEVVVQIPTFDRASIAYVEWK